MIDSLAEILDDFPGAPNWTRCFAHTLNLVAKCIMRQFDPPKTKKRQGGDGWDKAFVALDALADEIESDNNEDDKESESEENEDREIEEGRYDGREEVTAEKVRDLQKMVEPVQCVLVKVW